MNFYTSPISIDIDGVDVRLWIGEEEKTSPDHAPGTPDEAAVPNPVDLAQSFLDTQPKDERKKLEEALATEAQDMGASVAVSDDGNEEDAFGTGQTLTLPGFLGDFLQGIVDRMQLKIQGIIFQLDADLPVDPSSPTTEAVSFQIALGDIDVEGVTTLSAASAEKSTIVPKEGKRHVSLNNVRAYLLSEADVFSALARSPSMVSPSLASSPAMTRNPPSREPTFVPFGSIHSENSKTSPGSPGSPGIPGSPEPPAELTEPLDPESPDSDDRMGDSEDALGIPYDFSDSQGNQEERQEEEMADEEEEELGTPRASIHQDFFDNSPEQSMFHSTLSARTDPHAQSIFHSTTLLESDDSEDTEEEEEAQGGAPLSHSVFHSVILPEDQLPHSTAFGNPTSQWADVPAGSTSQPALSLPPKSRGLRGEEAEREPQPGIETASGESSGEASVEDLTMSHLYTHEEAESMYMSAFSEQDVAKAPVLPEQSVQPLVDIDQELPTENRENHECPEELEGPHTPIEPRSITPTPPIRPHVMPGGWEEEAPDSSDSEPAFASRASLADPSSKSTALPAGTPGILEDKLVETPADTDSTSAQPPKGLSGQDEVPTPKGPPRLVKEILTLRNVSLYLPSTHQQTPLEMAPGQSTADLSQSLGRSIYPQAPGAFSIHGAGPSLSRTTTTASPPREIDDSIEVDLSPIVINFDASFGFLLAMLVKKLTEMVKPVPTEQKTEIKESKQAKTAQADAKSPNFKLTLQEISLNFINRLGGVTDTLERSIDPAAFLLDHEVLLNATLQNLSISSKTVPKPTSPAAKIGHSTGPQVETRIDLQKFRFGYADGDIVSFDSGRPMSTSVRDTFLTSGTDIAAKIMQSKGNIRTDIETLPLVIQIDLQRLDETFSWFGGLSGFLNMSTSITSINSPTIKPAPLPAKKPRGVRFEAPLNPEIKSAAPDNKMNLRVGGAYVELQGKDCSVSGETSAIKVVSRDEGIGIAFGILRVSGPFLNNSLAEPPITTEISGVRLEYLMAPAEADLAKLLELILPSKLRFDKKAQDEIMVDTLLRQRKKGAVMRVTVDGVNVRLRNLATLSILPQLGDEIAKLAAVAKYLPEDDRPGILTLAKVGKLNVNVDVGGQLGRFHAHVEQFEAGHVPVPSLVAVAAHGINVKRNETQELVSSAAEASADMPTRSPVIMARMIGDEIEPVIKLRLHNVSVEYRVPFIMDLLGLAEDATPQDFEAGLAASVANLGDHTQAALARPPPIEPVSPKQAKPMTLDIVFHDCLLGLNPLNIPSKMVVALTDAHLQVVLPQDVEMNVVLDINKSSVLLIDNVEAASEQNSRIRSHRRSASTSKQISDMCSMGFVDVCFLSSAKIEVQVLPGANGEKQIEVDFKDDLFVMETCADSTQTLITLVNALKPPTPPNKEPKFRTEVMPVNDLLASISAEAFGPAEGEFDFDHVFANAKEMEGSTFETDSVADESILRFDRTHFEEHSQTGEEMFDAMKSSGLSLGTHMTETADGVVIEPSQAPTDNSTDSPEGLEIHDDFFGQESDIHKTAKLWNSISRTYDGAPNELVKRSPVKVRVRDVHFIWHLFDGYDWAHTRNVITKAVQDLEDRAAEQRNKYQGANIYEEEVEGEEAIGDFLFNSIYIGIPAQGDPNDLARAINQQLNDNATETESIATSAQTGASNRTVRPHSSRGRRPRLGRSRHHKITFELSGVSADVVMYPDEGAETQSSIDVRINNLDIFDDVPTSTWKKFATYDQDAGERELESVMVHAEILNVKPVIEMPASEVVMRITILPVRLHVDQDALDFITRFFEFKDDTVPVHASESDVPFIQRAEVFDVPVKLDYKPKHVDYSGIRSGHFAEFKNFVILEGSSMVLRHAILYGISGFDRVGQTLNDIWTPDVKQNQLPGVIAGLAPVRSLVTIGSGFKDLIEIPVKEYQKDGRIIRSIQKGATSFARTTGTELIKLGTKLAVGTQYALQGAEGMLGDNQQQHVDASWAEDESDVEEERRQISLYADQPKTLVHGVRGGYRSLARDINMARDAIIAIPGEVSQSQGPGGAARAVWKRAPTIVFRPAMGVSKAIGQTLMGATNQIDPHHQRRINEVSWHILY